QGPFAALALCRPRDAGEIRLARAPDAAVALAGATAAPHVSRFANRAATGTHRLVGDDLQPPGVHPAPVLVGNLAGDPRHTRDPGRAIDDRRPIATHLEHFDDLVVVELAELAVLRSWTGTHREKSVASG